MNISSITTRDLHGRRTLVTGASGFIGTRLCRRLLALGARVDAVSRSPRADAEGLSWHRLELADPEAVEQLVADRKPELVFHLASRVAGARSLELVPETFAANLTSSVNLLSSVTRQGAQRLVLAGSLEEPDPEQPNPLPSSPYAAAKWAAAGYARMFRELYQTPVVCARIFMVYGPGQRDLRKLVPYSVLSLLRGQRPRLSSGSRPVDWVYVDDVVEGLILLAQNAQLTSSVDLGSGRLVSVREVVERIAGLLPDAPRPEFGALEERPLEQVRVADVEASAQRIGWRPRVELDEGLRRTIDWYRDELAAGRLGPEV